MAAEHVEVRDRGARLMLWIDGVGGYLVCLGDVVTIGQPADAAPPAVPIVGDLSRRHAAIVRSGESYLIEPAAEVSVRGAAVCVPTLLADGDEIALRSVRLVFRRPHPLSATARLDLASRHRTATSATAVLLMAESCVLGPRSDSHVVCPGWPGDVLLYRGGGKLHCRAAGPIACDGIECGSSAVLPHQSRVRGEGFSFSVEEV